MTQCHTTIPQIQLCLLQPRQSRYSVAGESNGWASSPSSLGRILLKVHLCSLRTSHQIFGSYKGQQVTSEVPVIDIASPKCWRILFQKWYASKSGVDATQGALFLTPSGVSPHLYVSGNQKWWWVWRELLIHLKFATPTTQVQNQIGKS